MRKSTSVSCFLPSEGGIKWFRDQEEDSIWRDGNLLMLNFSHWRKLRKEPCSKKNTGEEGNKKHSSSSPSPNLLAQYSHWRGSFTGMKEGRWSEWTRYGVPLSGCSAQKECVYFSAAKTSARSITHFRHMLCNWKLRAKVRACLILGLNPVSNYSKDLKATEIPDPRSCQTPLTKRTVVNLVIPQKSPGKEL